MSARKPAHLIALALAAACVATLAAALLPTPGALSAEAQGRVRCQVYVTQSRPPGGLSEKGLLGFARSHNARIIDETREPALDDRSWQTQTVFAFNQPPGDLEFQALFYDVEDGHRDFIQNMSIFVSDRAQRTFLQSMRLTRPEFRPNRRVEMVVTLRRQEVGTIRFAMRGEDVRRSGQVDFTDEQARGGPGE